jgi:hypothetical protein
MVEVIPWYRMIVPLRVSMGGIARFHRLDIRLKPLSRTPRARELHLRSGGMSCVVWGFVSALYTLEAVCTAYNY